MAKVFYFHGKTWEDVKNMSFEEFMKLLPSRKRRSLKRGLNDSQKILLKTIRNAKPDKMIRTHVRSMIIVPEMVGKRFMIHDGKDWNIVDILPEMLGHYLGEFSLTRERVTHSGPGIGATRGTKFISVK
jgi:small subunit ribosomal protein S19